MAEQKNEMKPEAKIEDKKQEMKPETKVEVKKEQKKQAPKKDHALVHGWDLPISTKQSIDVCSMIRGRTIEKALAMLGEVLLFKRAVHMNKREMPHQHGKGVMAGRFPQRATRHFIELLKTLSANANVNGLESPIIVEAFANRASEPYGKNMVLLEFSVTLCHCEAELGSAVAI